MWACDFSLTSLKETFFSPLQCNQHNGSTLIRCVVKRVTCSSTRHSNCYSLLNIFSFTSIFYGIPLMRSVNVDVK